MAVSTSKSNAAALFFTVGLAVVGICTLVLVWNVPTNIAVTSTVSTRMIPASSLVLDMEDTKLSPTSDRGRESIHATTPEEVVVVVPLTEWTNDRNVVHVLQTRFMQNQPNLIALGQARLELFRALTVPSIQHQTVQQFIWIIRTDPLLHANLREQLIAAVSMVPNAVLVASNHNPEGWRCPHCISDITSDTVLVGSYDLVQSYYTAAATHVVLETRCDADDAVTVDFVELLQVSATSGLWPLQNDWMVWCAENHLEWQYDSPWATNSSNDTAITDSSNDNTIAKGALLALKAGHCITPGLTWGYAVNATRADIPVSKHQKIQKQVKPCGARIGFDGEPLQSKCLVKLGGDFPLALRARTPTSAGMEHVLISNQTEDMFPLERLQKSKFRSLQNELWSVLFVLFGVEAEDLWNVRAHIEGNLLEIARDALEGQCTKGHSCKNSSKEVLKKLLDSQGSNQTGK
jgi:Putative rhamnosyl transferase